MRVVTRAGRTQEHGAHCCDVFGVERDPVDRQKLIPDPNLTALLRWQAGEEEEGQKGSGRPRPM